MVPRSTTWVRYGFTAVAVAASPRTKRFGWYVPVVLVVCPGCRSMNIFRWSGRVQQSEREATKGLALLHISFERSTMFVSTSRFMTAECDKFPKSTKRDRSRAGCESGRKHATFASHSPAQGTCHGACDRASRELRQNHRCVPTGHCGVHAQMGAFCST